MTEETNTLPPLTHGADIPEFLKGDNWFNAEIDGDMLDFSKQYRPPRYTMERNGVPFADVGELHLVSGKPGNGKTGLMSQLEATTLCGSFGNLSARKVEHRIREGDTIIEREVPVRMLHIDTEQGEDDTIAFKNRVCSMSGMTSEEASKHFFILRLRDTETAEDRWRKILKAIYVVKPTDIFLDGMLDIVEDYNDQKECQPLIRKCMMLATYYDASLWAVLHENPMVDKLVGTLGSIAQRKVSEIFVVIKVKQSELKPSERRDDLPDIYFKVKQVKARGRDVEDWMFQYVSNAGGWGQPIEITETTVQDSPQDNEEEIIKAVVKALLEFMAPPKSEFYTNIVKELKKRMRIGEPKAKDYFNMANDRGVFHLPINKRYTLNTSECDAVLNDLPFSPNYE